MKRIQYFNIFLIFFNISASGQNTFLNNVCSDTRFLGPYIVMPAIIDSSSCYITIKNNELHRFMLNSGKVDSASYSTYLISIINGEQKFYYSTKKIRKSKRLDFEVITISDSVKGIAENGKDFFVNYYFYNTLMLKEAYTNYEKAIIYFLFKWEIAVARDCESGGLYIIEYE